MKGKDTEAEKEENGVRKKGRGVGTGRMEEGKGGEIGRRFKRRKERGEEEE